MQALLPGAISEDAAGELVDDLDLVVADQIMFVALEQTRRLQRLRNELFAPMFASKRDRQVAGPLREFRFPSYRQLDETLALFDPKILALLQTPSHRQGGLVHRQLGGMIRDPGDDKRRPRFVDQHAVRLVDNSEEQSAQHELGRTLLAARQPLDVELQPAVLPTQRHAIA